MLLARTSLTYEIHFCRKKEKEKKKSFFFLCIREIISLVSLVRGSKKIFPDFYSVHTCNTD